jgi:hypothetical protein
MGRITVYPELSGTDHAIAWHLLEKWNPTDGVAWPSYEYLALKTGKARSTVAESITRLIKAGHFERVSGGGRGHSNSYRPRLEPDTPELPFGETETVRHTGRFKGDKQSGQADGLMKRETVRNRRAKPSGPPTQTVRNRLNKPSGPPDPNPLMNPASNPASNPATPNHVDEAFEEWWRQLPEQRKGNEKGCREKFRKIVKSGEATTAQLLEAVMKYAASRDVARGFASGSLKWLNQRMWEIDWTHDVKNFREQPESLGETLRQRREDIENE